MRYQPRFPGVVPHTGVGWARATHPSAADPRRSVGPRDLHALGTPPALFLSQDQTLWQDQPPGWLCACALVCAAPATRGRRHDTMHHRATRPAAHAPLSTCQGPDPGTTPPPVTSGADQRWPGLFAVLPLPARRPPRCPRSAPRGAIGAARLPRGAQQNATTPRCRCQVSRVFSTQPRRGDQAGGTMAVYLSPSSSGEDKYTRRAGPCQGQGHLSRNPPRLHGPATPRTAA